MSKWHLLLLPLTLLTVSCRESANQATHFAGYLYQKTGTQINSTAVLIDLNLNTSRTASLVVHDESGAQLWSLQFVHSSSFEAPTAAHDLEGTLTLPSPWVTADLMASENCGQTAAEAQPQVQMCQSGDHFLLEIRDENRSREVTLAGNSMETLVPQVFETPKAYHLEELLSLARKMNFDSRIQYEKLVQARRNATASALNLLPHVNLSDYVANLVPTWQTMLGTVGDLLPFLLPNRWLQADEAQQQSLVMQDALLLMRADLANAIDGLATTLVGDSAALDFYSKLLARTQVMLLKIGQLESKKQIPDGSADHIRSQVDQMLLDIQALSNLVHQDRRNLAAAVGFQNPEAISELLSDPETDPLSQAKPLDASALITIVLERSLELRQLDHLLVVARDQKSETYFSWLDPANSPQTNLGFSIGENLAVAQSNIDQLLTRREQLQASLVQTLFATVDQWNQTVQAFPVLQDSLAVQERRISVEDSYLTPNSGLNTLDIEAVVVDNIVAGLRNTTTETQYRLARGKLKRLQLVDSTL